MVSRHHDQADTRALCLPHGCGGCRAHRVSQPHETDQRESVLDRLNVGRKLVHQFPGERQHPHPLVGHVPDLFLELSPELVLERAGPAGRHDLAAAIDHGLGRSLYEQQHLFARRVERAHALAFGVEGRFSDAREIRRKLLDQFGAGYLQEGDLEGVTSGRVQGGVVAQRGDL